MLSDTPLTPGPQRAGAAHDQVDLDAGLRGRVQRLDHGLLDQRIHLGDDARRLALLGVARLAPDRVEQMAMHA